MTLIRSALFVDFDNIYSGLREVEESAALAFATSPGSWLDWIERQRFDSPASEDTPVRRVLVRSMYLNPTPFGRFRPDFTRAGFSVIDCPSLTLQGKSSADIRMVLDIVDTLEHATRFDEFIIFSGDADFTPLLQRLRAHDRRTAILAVGPAAQAYKSAADYLIDVDALVEEGLRKKIGGTRPSFPTTTITTVPTPVAVTLTPASPELLTRIAARMLHQAETKGPIHVTELARTLREFPEFTRESNWLGHGSPRRLMGELVRIEPRLDIADIDAQSWYLRVRTPSTPVTSVGATAPEAGRGVAAAATTPSPPQERGLAAGTAVALPAITFEQVGGEVDIPSIERRVLEIVTGVVEASPRPVPLASAALQVTRTLGRVAIDSRWAEHGSFKALLRSVGEGPHLQISSDRGDAYVLDPTRHVLVRDTTPDPVVAEPLTLKAFAQRVANVTGAPFLSPDNYVIVFESIAHGVALGVFQIGALSVHARDLCERRGCDTTRQALQFVIKGIGFGGHKIGDESISHSPRDLAWAFRENVRKLCRNAQMALSEDELDLLDQWLVACDDDVTASSRATPPPPKRPYEANGWSA